MTFPFFAALLCISSALLSVEVQLEEPIYSDGTLKTSQGGIITAPEIRIQAKQIQYTHKEEGQEKHIQVFAEAIF